MTKFNKNLRILLAAYLGLQSLTNFAFANSTAEDSSDTSSAQTVTAKEASYNNNYDDDYYANEGRLLFKIKLLGILSKGKQSNLPAPTSRTPTTAGDLVENGYGIDTSTAIFFNDNIATELSLGFAVLRTKKAALAAIASNYGDGTYKTNKINAFMIPLTFTGQFHMAPFGAIRPYVGAGYHFAYMFTQSPAYKLNNANGPVLQLGVDFAAKDDTLITLDLKQYFQKAKVIYKPSITNGNSVSGKLKTNPLILSIGVGFRL